MQRETCQTTIDRQPIRVDPDRLDKTPERRRGLNTAAYLKTAEY